MSRNAWGRWGETDEIGALNLVGPSEVLAATGLVRQGRVVSLAQPLSKKTPVPSNRTGLLHFMDRDGGDYAAGARIANGFQFADDSVVMPLHIGTHIDALCHVWTEDQLYNGHPGSGTNSTHGAKKCGVEKLPPIVTRGLLLDVAALHDAPLPFGYAIGLDELKAAANRAGVVPTSGDAILIRTGWLESQTGKPAHTVDFNEEPGLDVEAGLWLAERDVAVVGADNFAIEAIPFPAGTVFPVHQRLIRDYGIALLEGLVLESLAATGRSSFLFMACPLPVVGGTGSPITPVVVL